MYVSLINFCLGRECWNVAPRSEWIIVLYGPLMLKLMFKYPDQNKIDDSNDYY